jgi:hypothetical protein
MKLIERIQAPTPALYRKIRNTGMVLAATGATVLGAPVALPVILVKAAGYLALAGSVASAISQTVTYEKPITRKEVRHGTKRVSKPRN